MLREQKYDAKQALKTLISLGCKIPLSNNQNFNDLIKNLGEFGITLPIYEMKPKDLKPNGESTIRIPDVDVSRSEGEYLCNKSGKKVRSKHMIVSILTRLKLYYGGKKTDLIDDSQENKLDDQEMKHVRIKTVPNRDILMVECKFYTKEYLDLGDKFRHIRGLNGAIKK